MTVKTISGTYASGYTLAASYSGLSVTSAGRVSGTAGAYGFPGGPGGAGVSITKFSTVINSGSLSGGAGGIAGGGGSGSAGGAGGVGLVLSGGGAFINYGTVTGANGGPGARYGGTGGNGGAGVALSAFGRIFNHGTILGGLGGAGGYLPRPPYLGPGGSEGYGVTLSAAGSLTNFAGGLIEGVGTGSGAVTIVNFGLLDGTVELSSTSDVLIAESGSTTGGSLSGGGGKLELLAGPSAGTIFGAYGFGSAEFAPGGSWVFEGSNSFAGGLTAAGGTVTLVGALSDGGAGDTALDFKNGVNLLVLDGGSQLVGQAIGDGAKSTVEFLSGSLGASLGEVDGLSGFDHMTFAAGASWIFQGQDLLPGGMTIGAGGTVTDVGTISDGGDGGVAVDFASGGKLVLDQDASVVGKALGDGGASSVELAGSGGAIDGLGVVAAISGSANASLQGFGAYVLDSGTWTLAGENTLVGGSLTNSGDLGISGVLDLNSSGALRGVGQITIESSGVVDATGTGSLSGVTANNGGLIEATGGGSLLLSDSALTSGTAGEIEANGAGSRVDLQSVAVQGGVLEAAGGGLIATFDSGSVLNGFAHTIYVEGPLSVGDNTALTIEGAIADLGSIKVGDANGFATLYIGVGTTLTGKGTVTLGDSIFNEIADGADGKLGKTPSLTNADDTISGAGYIHPPVVNDADGVIVGTGTNRLILVDGITNAGLIECASAAGMEIDGVSNTGDIEVTAGALVVQRFSGGGLVSVVSGARVDFIEGGAFYGAIGGEGTANFSGEDPIFSGTTFAVANAEILAATVSATGTITVAHDLTFSSGDFIVGAAGVTLEGGGVIAMTNQATNRIVEADSSATLTDVNDRLTGAGQIGDGQLTLVNESGGVIGGNDPSALVINTGSNMIDNAGVIESTGTGGTLVKSAVDNSGKLTASAGVLTIDGPVIGAGSVVINGGVISLLSSFTQDVTFGASGTLELAESQGYTGALSGFSKTGRTRLDLTDIDFGATTKASYSGSASRGTLTVTDGVHVARCQLFGDYLGSVFKVSNDGQGGTIVTDPSETSSPENASTARPGRFAAMAASFGATAAGEAAGAREPWRSAQPLLAAHGDNP